MALRCFLGKTCRIFDTDHSGCVVHEPQRPILQRFYRCDKRFHVDPLMELSLDASIFGLVWCSGDNVDMYEFYANYELKKLKSCSAHLKNSHRKGGQSQKRFERLIEGQRNDYFQHIGETIEQVFKDRSIQRLFIIGNSHKQVEIQKRLVGSLRELSELVTADGLSIYDVLKTLNLNRNVRSDKYLHMFYDQLHTGQCVYGIRETQDCLEAGQLKVMFSAHAQDIDRCTCVNTEFVHVSGMTALEQKFLSEFGTYGGLTRWKVEE